ncbi:hypothetical protein LCGC14_1910660, partial [marine sediment metagenome]
MPNSFFNKPELEKHFPLVKDVWTCPITGLKVPKDPAANLQWRAKILELADEDEEFREDLYTACSQSVLFFVNAFVFTLLVFEVDTEGPVKQAEHKHIPMVTWDVQDTHILRIEECIIKGLSLLSDKSRNMGATWNHLVELTHRFLFADAESHLILSRKEDTVDILDGQPKQYPYGPLADPGTLFGKIDYILAHLPEWMVPRCNRKKMHLVNLDNKTRIDGESANATAGSSDRRTSIFMDEMAKMEHAEDLLTAILPTVEHGKLVCFSSARGMKNTFAKTYWNAKRGLNEFVPLFIPYNVLPGRDRAWWKRTTANFPGWKALQEYPSTQEEAFLTAGECLFDVYKL